jgi:ABC-2 type transport system permease protein
VRAVLLGLRLGRWGLAGFGLGAFAAILVQTLGFYQIAGHTAVERAQFAASMTVLASEFIALFPPPLAPGTVGGFVQFRGLNPLTVLFAIWALVAATGFARGDEERGIVESELATGLPRTWLVASRAGAFTIAIVVASAAAMAGLLVGVASGHESVEARGVVEACALLVAIGLACYGVALLVAQLTAARYAAAAAAVVLLALYFVNSLGRTVEGLASWRWLSPFRYYELSQPLPPQGYFDGRGFAVLVGIAVVTSILAAIAFERRDLGSALIRPPARVSASRLEPSLNPVWRFPVVRGVYERRLGIVVWAAGMAALAALFVSLTRTIVQVLLSIPTLLPYLSIFVQKQVYPAVLGYTWFNVAQLLFAGMAIAHVARWSAEDVDGRLETALSTPYSRAAVVLERMAILVAAGLVVTAASGVTLYFVARSQGIDLDAGRLVAASLLLIPFSLVFAAAGSLLAGWNPRAAVGMLGVFAFASYLDVELAAIFKLPAWLQDLSAFKLFGTPLLSGIDGRNLALMLLLVVAGVGSSILLMERRDVGR